ncbi:hypothetical protein ACLOJK_032520 [Asimina triloba]
MRKNFSLKSFSLIILIVFLAWFSSFDSCSARRGKHWRQKKGKSGNGHQHGGSKGGGGGSKTSHPPAPPPPPKKETSNGYSTSFSVLDFGAKGDGKTDDTKAFEAAWAAACKAEASTMLVPAEYTFLVGPITFSGPYCQPNIVFQLEGTIIAPTDFGAWGSGLFQWLLFTKLIGITVRGSGTLEGRGSVWWSDSQVDDPWADSQARDTIFTSGQALRFYGSFNVTVMGITIQNSPQCHLKFDNCVGVLVHDMTVSSPGDSPNTDGIHLQNSRDVMIHGTNLACGHGISIGGLGKDNTKACVSNITVRDIIMHNTMNGVRIKTWQGGSGSVQGIQFSNIQVSEVQTPIVIDQFYCDKSKCKNQTSAVALSGINYENIKGTYTVKPVHLACADSLPCTDVTLTEIELKPVQERYHLYDPYCWHTFGELLTPSVPPISCLQIGKPTSNRIQSDHDSC